jgi:thiopurine S-methyltransferase
LITLDYDQSEMSGPPFCVQHQEVERLFSSRYQIDELASLDALLDSPHFRQRGLTALTERIYRLKPRP